MIAGNLHTLELATLPDALYALLTRPEGSLQALLRGAP